jgi:hypothetical protein
MARRHDWEISRGQGCRIGGKARSARVTACKIRKFTSAQNSLYHMTFEQHSQRDQKPSIRPIRALTYCDRIPAGTQNHIKQAH